MKYNARTDIEHNIGALNFFLHNGLKRDNCDSWRYLQLLNDICTDVPQCKNAVAELIRIKYAPRIGELLNTLDDFQWANFLIELLAHCFPRKSKRTVGVVLPPKLWDSKPELNEKFFDNPLYPFYGKHGDAQVINFIWDICGGEIKNLVRLNNVTYGSSSNGSGGKRLKAVENGGSQFCYIQARYGSLYLWNGDGMFLEMNRRRLNVTQNLKGKIKIYLGTKAQRCINSKNKLWLEKLHNVKWFQLNSSNYTSSEGLFKELTLPRKISEVQSFLALDHTDEENVEPTAETLAKTAQTLNHRFEEGDLKSNEVQVRSIRCLERKDQLVTPERSDARIGTDEWDFNPTSEQQGTAISKATQSAKQVTPGQSDELPSSSRYVEESPVVLAQKRKKVRETTKTLETLRRGFTIASETPPLRDAENRITERSPSVMITKFETKVKGFNQLDVGKKIETPKIKAVNSIGAKDITVLDKIFGKADSGHKRTRRQQRLKNFKPVIEVPSQELLAAQNKDRNKGALPRKKKVKEAHAHVPRIDKGAEKAKDAATQTKPPCVSNSESRTIPLKRAVAEKTDQQSFEKKPKTDRAIAAEVPRTAGKKVQSKPENCENRASDNTSLLDSTTMLSNLSHAIEPISAAPTGNAFTDRLSEQIFSSITHFSNEMTRKMALINKELNHKIVKELSEKYQKLFQGLQRSFQSDTEEMLKFMAEIGDMMNLPENELVQVIRNHKFGDNPSDIKSS